MNENNYIKALLVGFAILTMFIVARAVAAGNFFVAFGVIAALFVGGITFLNPENGIIVLVFSMLLSPEIEIAKIPGRPITLRIDDLLLIAVFVSFLTYHAVNFRHRRFRRSPIDVPLIAMILVYVMSTSLGILEGRLKPLGAMFFTLKYIQYFIIFWLVLNIVNSRKMINDIVVAGAITAAIVCIYAYSLFLKVQRVYAPFDYESIGGVVGVGESATLGGYLILVMGQAISFFLNSEKPSVRYVALAILLFCLPPFVRTLSRASYYSFAAMCAAFVFVTPKRRLLWIFIMAATMIIAPLVAQDMVNTIITRLKETFTGPVSELGIDLELSAAARVDSWLKAFREWIPARPLLGHGATGVGLVDAQYPKILGEFGLVGFGIFLWLIFSIFKSVKRVMREVSDETMLAISAGFLASLVGLLVQSVGVNTFIIVRIMTPFWFLCALVMILPTIDFQNES